jgi:hypothetical protein
LFTQYNADPNIRNKAGESPLQMMRPNALSLRYITDLKPKIDHGILKFLFYCLKNVDQVKHVALEEILKSLSTEQLLKFLDPNTRGEKQMLLFECASRTFTLCLTKLTPFLGLMQCWDYG